MNVKKNLLKLSMFILLTIPSFAIPTIHEVLVEFDKHQELTSDIRAKVEMTHKRVNQGVRKVGMIYYRRDSDDSFLIVMLSPENDKGNGYLRMGDNFWMYRRNTRTFQHINRDESIAGTDARGDDFEMKKSVDLYEAEKDENGNDIIIEDTLGKIPVYKLKVKAKDKDVDYPRKTFYVRKDNFLSLKEQSYSESGTLMETAYYTKYTIVDGSYVAINMLFIDEFEKGNKTLVQISGISTETLDDSLFTKAYLENLSK